MTQESTPSVTSYLVHGFNARAALQDLFDAPGSCVLEGADLLICKLQLDLQTLNLRNTQLSRLPFIFWGGGPGKVLVVTTPAGTASRHARQNARHARWARRHGRRAGSEIPKHWGSLGPPRTPPPHPARPAGPPSSVPHSMLHTWAHVESERESKNVSIGAVLCCAHGNRNL